jgi:hypothetical protein
MFVENIRRISAVLMALVLAIGLATHGFGAPDMMVKSNMIAASDMPISSDMPMQGKGKCNGCAGDEKGVAPAGCSAFCGAVVISPSVMAVLNAVPAETLSPIAEAGMSGNAYPPDPYPPRPTILS